MFANLRIGAKLALGFGLTVAITALVGAASLYNTTRFMADAERLEESSVKGAAFLANAQSALWQLRWDVAQFIAVDDPAERRKLVENGPVQAKIVMDNLTAFANGYRTDEELAALARLRESFQKYSEARPRWFELYLAAEFDKASEWRARTITTYGRETVAAFGELIRLQRKASDDVHEAAVARMTTFRLALAALLAAAVVLGAAVAWWITRSITRPLARAVVVTSEVAEGNLAIEVRSQGRDESAQVLQSLARMRDALAEAVDTIRQAAQDVGTASRQIAHGNTEMSSRTEEQASSLEETASSMEELTTTVRQNADNARQANELAIGASAVAAQGGKAMEEVIATMGGISEASRRIADIIGVIDGIAFQTNILALNAAVEAARAGEQGRGFAVVAAEVRSLAQRSAEAAREIKGLIEASAARVDDGTRQVQGAGKTIQGIVEAVERVTGIMAEIATASREQLSGIEQVSNAIVQMDRVTQQNASLVEQTAAAAEHMSGRAQQLLASVARFNLGAAQASAAPPERVGAPAVPGAARLPGLPGGAVLQPGDD